MADRKINASCAKIISLLQDFVLAVVSEKPVDITDFAAAYFNSLKERQNKEENEERIAESVNKEVVMSSNAINPPLDSSDFGESSKIFTVEAASRAGESRLLTRRKSIAGEPYQPFSDSSLEHEDTFYPKSQEARNRVKEIVKEIFIFKSCSVDQLEKIIDAMYERKVFTGEIIIRQGNQGDNLFVVDKGKFDVWFEFNGHDGTAKQKIGSIEGPGSFGELALMYTCPRAASVTATEDGVVWVLDRLTFKRILVTTTERKRRHYEELLENMPILSLLTAYERTTLADALQTKVFEDNHCIVSEGDAADCMYFIEDGCVEISAQNGKEDGEIKIISHSKRGDYFGELALVCKTNRVASVHACGRVTCAYLDVNAFERLLGPCKDLMKRNVEKYETQRQMLGSKEQPF